MKRSSVIKTQRKLFVGMKEMVIDFICREDLVITTLKEFFEIFISSIKKRQVFHLELLSKNHKHIGLVMEFQSDSSVGTIRLFMANEIISE